ncbi:MAG: hypothetical protein V8Q58_01190 [Anaerobutyricum hallii]|uniref:type I restriction endonuclease subunit R, EcoR124 family n=1 Tax=Anaerobutyricum hallii TaxID=39488 RepID=UPI00300EAD15
MLEQYGITEQEYDDYVGHYKNVMEEFEKKKRMIQNCHRGDGLDQDYELMAYSNTKIDYEYIINLIQILLHQQKRRRYNTRRETEEDR